MKSPAPPASPEDFARLEERVRKLAAEKAGLELLFRLMSRLTELPGLSSVVDAMLQSIMDTIGGTNVALYYWIDGQINYADVYGQRQVFERIEDPDVQVVADTRMPLEIAVDLSHSQLMGSLQTEAWSWVLPLLAGQELIGILKVEHANLQGREFQAHLPNFLTYAAAVLKNDIFGHSQLMAAYAALTQSNASLAQARDAAEAATRAKSAFLANMSHELRTPLNAVLGFAQLMSRDSNITPGQRRNLLAIEHSGLHLLELINDILELSRGDAGKLKLRAEPFDLDGLLSQLMEMVVVRAQSKGLALNLSCMTTFPPQVKGDAYRLKQVLINLLNNAVKYTAAGTVSLAAEWHDDTCRFEVSDTGQGLQPDEMKQLFQPFYQTALGAAQNDGSGLGLAISNDYVRLMGGKIEVRSAPGMGSRFGFTIPLPGIEQPADADAGTETVIGLANPHQHWRVLVVDDDENSRRILTELLRPLGFEVEQANDGLEGVQRFMDWHPHFIWMDTHMPELNGIEATRRIRKLSSGAVVPVFAVTATSLGDDLDRMIEAGATGFVNKPFKRAEILETLRRELGLAYSHGESSRAASEHANEPQAHELNEIPPDLRHALIDAAESLSIDEARAAIDALAVASPALASGLQRLVDDYRFEDLAQLLTAKPD